MYIILCFMKELAWSVTPIPPTPPKCSGFSPESWSALGYCNINWKLRQIPKMLVYPWVTHKVNGMLKLIKIIPWVIITIPRPMRAGAEHCSSGLIWYCQSTPEFFRCGQLPPVVSWGTLFILNCLCGSTELEGLSEKSLVLQLGINSAVTFRALYSSSGGHYASPKRLCAC